MPYTSGLSAGYTITCWCIHSSRGHLQIPLIEDYQSPRVSTKQFNLDILIDPNENDVGAGYEKYHMHGYDMFSVLSELMIKLV